MLKADMIKVNKLYLQAKTCIRWSGLSEGRGVKFPISEAFAFSLESIKRRFGRAIVTMASIILGISFLSFLLTTGRLMSAMYQEESGLIIEAYQIWMAVIAILICAVGIVNSMLMSVTERYKEIGTMKCLGAMNSHVVEIFLIEAFLLGLIGGGIGAATGWGIATLWQYFLRSNPEAILNAVKLWTEFFVPSNFNDVLVLLSNPLISIVLGIFISLISSLVPAYIASRLSPTEALRYEA
jgi:ABC-type antimicrobial peptide transport system permease subunit